MKSLDCCEDKLTEIVEVLLVGMSHVDRTHRASACELLIGDGDATRLEHLAHLWNGRLDNGTRTEADDLLHHIGSEGLDELSDAVVHLSQEHASTEIECIYGLSQANGSQFRTCAGEFSNDVGHLCGMAKLTVITDCCLHITLVLYNHFLDFFTVLEECTAASVLPAESLGCTNLTEQR